MEIQLTPENLGKINLSVASKDGIITATITTQNEAVKAIVESQLIQLKEALNNQGLKVNDVEVTIAGQAFDRNAENDNGKGSSEQRSYRKFKGIEELSGDNADVIDESILEQMMEADGNSLNLKA
jgi:flagellar hook-length control protein FliK